MLMKYGIVGVR